MLVLEENGETGLSVLGVADVDLVTAVMLTRVANVETTCSMWGPCFTSAGCYVCFYLASEW